MKKRLNFIFSMRLLRGLQLFSMAGFLFASLLHKEISDGNANWILLFFLIPFNMLVIGIYIFYQRYPVASFFSVFKENPFWGGVLFYLIGNTRFWVMTDFNLLRLCAAVTFLISLFFTESKKDLPASNVVTK
jgi:hypothetical protein